MYTYLGMAKVFIIEDNKEISHLYERAFHLGGYETECALNGKEAVDRLVQNSETPSVILLDVILPGVSGIDILRTMKEDERLKHIPVIVMTNSLGSDDENLFKSLGANRYLIKMDTDPASVVKEANELIGRK
jgi:CheY-like chemotaxis protein